MPGDSGGRKFDDDVMTFYVGQRVIRVGYAKSPSMSAECARSLGYSYPMLGEVVTIKTLNVWLTGTILTFHEHDNSHIQRKLDSRYEPGFDARAFRPLTERGDEHFFTADAPKDSEKWDNRRKVKEPAHG